MKKPPPATTAEQAAPPWVDVASSSLPGGALVKLVQLRAVVRWLMESKSLHFLPAAVALHDALQTCETLKLYLDFPGGSAHPVGAGDTFQGVLPAVRGGVARRDPALRPLLPGVTPGQSAALSYLNNVWCNARNSESAMDWGLEWSNNDPSKAATYLAVSCEQAAALWGEKLPLQADTGALLNAAAPAPEPKWEPDNSIKHLTWKKFFNANFAAWEATRTGKTQVGDSLRWLVEHSGGLLKRGEGQDSGKFYSCEPGKKPKEIQRITVSNAQSDVRKLQRTPLESSLAASQLH